MYGYGLEGYGYRYPRRKRQMTVAAYYYPGELQDEYIKAAVFNKAIASENPWIKFLRKEKFYDDIRNKLRDLRDKYQREVKQGKIEENRLKALKRELMKLQAEKSILEGEQKTKKLAKSFAEKFKDRVSYDTMLQQKIDQLEDEIKRIQSFLAAPQQVLPLPPS
jgi:predicted nuclease with TOPRIM domain